MTVDLLLKNGIVISEGREQVQSVAISRGRIDGVFSESDAPDSQETLDCRGLYILPGAIDIHVHLRDLNESRKEDYYSGTRAAAAGGVTSVVDMPNSNPPVLANDVLEEKIEIARLERYVNIGFYAGISKDTQNLEWSKKSKILGLKVYPHNPLDNGVSYTNERILECSRIAKEVELPLLFHPDSSDPSASPVNNDDFFRLHSCSKELDATRRFIDAHREVGNRLHVCHVSCATTMKIISENRAEMNLTAEVTPHHLFLNSIDSVHDDGTAKTLPPLRSPYDSKVLLEGLKTCTIDCVVSDHAPHLDEERRKPFLDSPSGIPGLETLVPLLLTEVFSGRLTWAEYLRACSSGPALLMGLGNKGLLAAGYDADLMIARREVSQIQGERFFSKAKITPFEGAEVLAKLITTIVDGQVIYSEGEFMVEPGMVGRVPLMKNVL